jgi:enhancer of yellow 2 transcription factor
MSAVKWENVPDSEVRAEVEAVLESQGEAEQIRSFLNDSPAVAKWRLEVRELCKRVIRENGVESLISDNLFDQISPQARDMMPEDVRTEIRSRLELFLQTQFEDHIMK